MHKFYVKEPKNRMSLSVGWKYRTKSVDEDDCVAMIRGSAVLLRDRKSSKHGNNCVYFNLEVATKILILLACIDVWTLSTFYVRKCSGY